jgi:hypothetical protein
MTTVAGKRAAPAWGASLPPHMAADPVQGCLQITVYTTRMELKRPVGTHNRGSARWVRHFDILTIRVMRCLVYHKWGPIHTDQQRQPNQCSRTARKANHYPEKRMRRTINTMRLSTGGHKSDKKFQTSVFIIFLKHSFIVF